MCDQRTDTKRIETDKKMKMYVMTQEQIDQISAIAGKAAVNTFRTEQIKAEKKQKKEADKVNKTKNMLNSYRRIKSALSNEQNFTEEEQIEFRWKFIQDLMGSVKETEVRSERVINDTERRRQENLHCIYLIEKAVEMYREECEKSGNEEMKRRYRELSMMYLEEKEYTVQEISQIEKISDKTIYKDLGIACRIIAVYLFGFDVK